MNISLKVTHIPGKVNVIADFLSRWHSNPHLEMLSQFLPTYSCVPISNDHIFIDWSIYIKNFIFLGLPPMHVPLIIPGPPEDPHGLYTCDGKKLQ